MENITILGAGVAGLALIEKIRARNITCNITLINKDSYSFPRRAIISSPADISQRIDLNQWAEARKVDFFLAQVERINPRRRRLFFKDGQPRDFDNLIIASGLVSKKLPIKGEHRDGFFYLSGIDSLKLNGLLKISKEVCVYVSTWLGLRLAIALADLDKEVRIVSANLSFLEEDKQKVINALEEKKIVLYLDAFIEEAVGEGVVKAAKLSPLMVFSSQLVFIDSGFISNLKFFEEEVSTQDVFFTNFEGIYLLGDVNRKDAANEIFFSTNHQAAKKQADLFIDFMATGQRPVFSKDNLEQKDLNLNQEDISKEVKLWQSGLA
ncbi:MAG: FAD-dependent oxidoreductase [Candidatus Omnitrophota bacterium]